MRRSIFITSLIVCVTFVITSLQSSSYVSAKESVKVIYDTDMGNDIDDVFALTMLHNFEKRGEIDFLAITITKDNKYAAPYCQLINTFYQNPNVPIGIVKDSGVETFDGKYLRQTLEAKTESGEPKYPFFDFTKDDTKYYEATELLRKTLAEQEDGSVVIAQVGFSTNLARLLDTPADQYSPLTGRELVAKKVKYLVAMAGNYVEQQGEYNIIKDIPSAQKLFAEWPTSIYASGFEVGREIFVTSEMVKNDYGYCKNHPVKDAFALYRGSLDASPQCTWDLTTILFAARQDRGYFDLSEEGEISVDDKGITTFNVQEGGKARYFKVSREQILRVQEAFVWLCSEKM